MKHPFLRTQAALILTIAAAAFLAIPTAHGQTSSFQVSASWSLGSGNDKGKFTCFGQPLCTGTWSETLQDPGCSNSVTYGGTLSITGVSLSAPGAIGGTFTFTDAQAPEPHHLPNGTCDYTLGAREAVTFSYTGNWDGTRGTFTIDCTTPVCTDYSPDDLWTLTGSFTTLSSNAPPVFPITVTGSITPTVANAQATFQPRSQDAGTTKSTYVFALAPPGQVKNAPLAKDAPLACVLAQLNSNGQLTAVSASSLQAYATGVLSAQGNAVTILNNASTPNVAGATFFVGYGTNASSMITSGVNVSAVAIPGASACTPQPPQTGWWWNPAEGGRGYSIEWRDNKLFFAVFHYDASGRSSWNVASGVTSLDGSLFTGDLLGVRGGQTLGGPYTGSGQVSNAGPITLTFQDASHGTMVWPGGTVAIERFPLVSGGLEAAAQANVPESGWWWNPNESGRGFFIEWQKGSADIAGYMYDDSGNPVWYIAVYPTPNPLSFSGSWWNFGNGQTMGGAYKAPTQLSSNVAPLTITFTSATTATMTLPNNRTTALQRLRF